ncbi:MAG TPA: hypothetical protein VGK73_11390 [Polyangiaceae bacterium]
MSTAFRLTAFRTVVTLVAALGFVVLALVPLPTLSDVPGALSYTSRLRVAIGHRSLVPIILSAWVASTVVLALGRIHEHRRASSRARTIILRSVMLGAGAVLLWRAVEGRIQAVQFTAWAAGSPDASWASERLTKLVCLADTLIELALALAATRWGLSNGFALWLLVRAGLLLVPSFSPEPFWVPHPFFQPGVVVVPVALALAVWLLRVKAEPAARGDAPLTAPADVVAPRLPRVVAGFVPLWLAFWYVCGEEHLFRWGQALENLYGLAGYVDLRSDTVLAAVAPVFDWTREEWSTLAAGVVVAALLTVAFARLHVSPGRAERSWRRSFGDRLHPDARRILTRQWWRGVARFAGAVVLTALLGTFQPGRFPAEWMLFIAVAVVVAGTLDIAEEFAVRARRSDWVTVGEVAELHEAVIVTTRCEEQGIPVYVRGFHCRSLLAFLSALFPLTVLAPSADSERAKLLVNPLHGERS